MGAWGQRRKRRMLYFRNFPDPVCKKYVLSLLHFLSFSLASDLTFAIYKHFLLGL